MANKSSMDPVHAMLSLASFMLIYYAHWFVDSWPKGLSISPEGS